MMSVAPKRLSNTQQLALNLLNDTVFYLLMSFYCWHPLAFPIAPSFFPIVSAKCGLPQAGSAMICEENHEKY